MTKPLYKLVVTLCPNCYVKCVHDVSHGDNPYAMNEPRSLESFAFQAIGKDMPNCMKEFAD